MIRRHSKLCIFSKSRESTRGISNWNKKTYGCPAKKTTEIEKDDTLTYMARAHKIGGWIFFPRKDGMEMESTPHIKTQRKNDRRLLR